MENKENIEKQETQVEDVAEILTDEDELIDDDFVREKRSFREIVKTYFPIPLIVFYALALVAGGVHVACLLSEKFADFYNQNIGAFVRAVLAHLTSWIPFSLAEMVIISLPILVFAVIYISVKAFKKSDEASTKCIIALFTVLVFMYTIFVLGYGMGYHGTTLAEKLDLEEKEVSAEQLYNTANVLLGELASLVDEIPYSENGYSYMPYSLDEMNDKLNETYKLACKKYDFIQNLKSNIKYIVLSKPMTFTHISGVYTYYTGEANLNINFPDYTLPYTALHELAHQRGIAPENEANFVAFLVGIESDDVYIRYSAYLNMLEYVTNALYAANPDAYYAFFSNVDNRIKEEIIAYGDFFEEYRESVASEVSGVVNDTYLKTQGQSAGTASYGMVVDLTVAYYEKQAALSK